MKKGLSRLERDAAHDLFARLLIDKRNGFAALFELRDTMARATPAQREYIARFEDRDGHEIACATGFNASCALLEVLDVQRERAAERNEAARAIREALAEFNRWLADRSALAAAMAAPGPWQRRVRPRCTRQRWPGRSHDGKRPWLWRLRLPHRLS